MEVKLYIEKERERSDRSVCEVIKKHTSNKIYLIYSFITADISYISHGCGTLLNTQVRPWGRETALIVGTVL